MLPWRPHALPHIRGWACGLHHVRRPTSTSTTFLRALHWLENAADNKMPPLRRRPFTHEETRNATHDALVDADQHHHCHDRHGNDAIRDSAPVKRPDGLNARKIHRDAEHHGERERSVEGGEDASDE